MPDRESTSQAEEQFWRGGAPDPELEALGKGRPRGGRHPFLALAVIVLGLLMLWWLRNDILYFFRPSAPAELGDAVEVDPRKIASNSHVAIEGFPNPIQAVKFSKRLHGGFYRVFPLVGTRGIFIQTHVKEEKAEGGKKKPAGNELEGEFEGRAISFGALERSGFLNSSYRAIRSFFFEKFMVEIPDDAILVMHEEPPKSYWMYPVAGAVVLAFVLANAALLAMPLVRRRRATRGPATPPGPR